MTTKLKSNPAPAFSIGDRVTSIDFFRGLTMFLLMGESTELYRHFSTIDSSFMHFLGTQFDHHEWHGLQFWDLIQPFFMFIVGVAIPFAVYNRIKKGASQKSLVTHAFKRSLLLFVLGWALYFRGSDHIVFRLQNVLAQLSVTYLVAFLIMRKSFSFQLIFTLAILLLTDLAYRFFPVEGFNQPWVAFHNLGAWVNTKIEGTSETSIWATLNAIPTIAHTVWGVLCGKLLMSDKTPKEKIQRLVIAGVIALAIGFGLDLLNITPIIKKIATASFVFASGGWAILALAFSYWLIDVKKLFAKGSQIFIVVGMNCIFIYLFFSLNGAWIITEIVKPVINSLFGWSGAITSNILTSLVVWYALWYITFWMYKNKIFIKI
jgi:predicted acyltransferase